MAVERVGETLKDVRTAFGLPDGETTPREALTAAQPRFRFLTERPEATIQLIYPFALGAIEYTEYTLRRLNAEQAAEVGDELRKTGEMATLYSAMTGLPYLAVKKMDADDAEAMAAAAVNFMPAALREVMGQ